MHANMDELPEVLRAGDAFVRATDWGAMRAVVVSLPAGTDVGPLLQGHEGDLCPCEHWGYVIRGRIRIDYAEGSETLRAGDLYYMPKGHTGVAEEDTEFIEISPPGPHDEFLRRARINLGAAGE